MLLHVPVREQNLNIIFFKSSSGLVVNTSIRVKGLASEMRDMRLNNHLVDFLTS